MKWRAAIIARKSISPAELRAWRAAVEECVAQVEAGTNRDEALARLKVLLAEVEAAERLKT